MSNGLYDLTDRKAGLLRIKSRVACRGPVKWLCVCKCGNKVEIATSAILSGKQLGCPECILAGRARGLWAPDVAKLKPIQSVVGQRQADAAARRQAAAGRQQVDRALAQQRQKVYQTWKNIVRRCTDPTSIEWKNYGAFGVRVDAAWEHDFEAFFKEVGSSPSADHRLLRKDANGHYEPGNVEWRLEEWAFKLPPNLISHTEWAQTLRAAEKRGISSAELVRKLNSGIPKERLLDDEAKPKEVRRRRRAS